MSLGFSFCRLRLPLVYHCSLKFLERYRFWGLLYFVVEMIFGLRSYSFSSIDLVRVVICFSWTFAGPVARLLAEVSPGVLADVLTGWLAGPLTG